MSVESSSPEQLRTTSTFQWHQVVWYNVVILALWHIGGIYTLFYIIPQATVSSLLVLWVGLWIISGLGITAGAHRLWSHKSYHATLPLRVFLMLCNAMAFQGDIYEWSRDHRVHHKCSDTDGDPHNSQRGFFFAHMGWVMVRKHPKIKQEASKINFSDLLQDPVVVFQRQYYLQLVLIMCYGLPTVLGWFMGSAWHGFWIGGIFRHVWVLHMTWCVNSVAHFFGYKPYDPKSRAVENVLVSIGAIGEGYHNYHHKYPSDYATSEWGITSGQWNPTKLFIDTMAFIGLASDMKRSRTAAATRERLAIQQHQEQLKKQFIPAPGLFDRLNDRLSAFFFGRSEAELF